MYVNYVFKVGEAKMTSKFHKNFFWVQVVCLSLGAAGFLFFFSMGLIVWILNLEPSVNNLFIALLLTIVLFVLFLPASKRAVRKINKWD